MTETLNYNNTFQTLSVEEVEPKNYLEMFIQLLKKDNCFMGLVNDIKHKPFIKTKENERYIKYINKPGLSGFYKRNLYEVHQISKLEIIINYLDASLKYDKTYNELKEHYYKPLKGSCVMGAHLYCFVVPKNLRKNTPDRKMLFTMGYSNGEMYKEYIQETFVKVLKAFEINIIYDGGSMD